MPHLTQAIQYSEWIIPILLLFAVAWTRFNSPPTNRSGTTFVMFSFGVVFYYALILALWLLVIIMLSQGSIGIDKIEAFWKVDLDTKAKLDQFSPIVAALIVVVASQFRTVSKIDTAARSFCVKLAAIPREADQLAVELAQGTDFEPPTDRLRNEISKIISENISPRALNFDRDGTFAARFTRAIALYRLFVAPGLNNTPLQFPANSHARTAYAKIMQLSEATVIRVDARYEELMHAGLVYFRSPHSINELEQALNRTISELSNLVCSLIARFVLYCDVTRIGRRQRLSSMGFDATHPMPSFGRDRWVMTILAVIVLSIIMMTLMPETRPIPPGRILTIAITFGLSIGFAVPGAILVAQRFIERNGASRQVFPPIAELTIAALIVAGLTVVLRIGIPLVPALIEGNGLDDVITQFVARWPGIIIPFVCTISLGLLCAYLGPLDWSWPQVATVGALGNGVAFMAAGALVGWLIEPKVLEQFFLHPEHARTIVVMNTGVTGVLIGAMVLAQFRKSERARRDVAELATRCLGSAALQTPVPLDDLAAQSPSRSEADRRLGGYSRGNVQDLEGTYVCFRPGFTSPDVINAYLMVVRWDEECSCLVFEEQSRIDAGHTQSGRVYVPDGKPFMNFVTVDKGAMRLIMVSRPEDQHQPARGLIMTLSNPLGTQFTPACAPVVLKRVHSESPQVGFIHPGSASYESYRQALDTVMPAFGFFSTAPHGVSEETVRLSVVR